MTGVSAGRVVSVNVAMPVAAAWAGRPGRTAIHKRPFDGPVRVHELGLEGDQVANTKHHGGPFQAVCLYAVEAIERVRADGHQAFPGAYGENLTLVGINWAGLRGGDQLEIGGSGAGPLLELTNDATPCTKQSRWFVDGRIGRISITAYPADIRWYASVAREGPVAAGDPVRLIRG